MHHDDLPTLESMQSRVRQFMGFEVTPPPKVDGYIKDGDPLKVGDETVRALHTPGHSPGSISLSGNGYVLTGEPLFNHAIRQTHLHDAPPTPPTLSIPQKLSHLTNH